MALKITAMLVSSSKYHLKCPHSMTPTGITVHETANDAAATSEIKYMITNNNSTSYHYAVDDLGAVQGIPLNRNAWHAGDGSNGTGNRKTIGIEICYSKSGGTKYKKAFDNGLTLVAQLMKKYNFTTKNIYFHKNWSGKNCPHRALSEGITLEKYRQLVQKRYDEMYKPATSSSSNGDYLNAFNNDRVKTLQTALNKDLKLKLDVDGWCGPATQDAMKKINVKPYPDATYNDFPNTIKFVQKCFGLTQDGSHGPATKEKVVALQKKYGYTANGNVYFAVLWQLALNGK